MFVLPFYLQIQLPKDRIYSLENSLHPLDNTAILGRPIMADHYTDAGLADSWLSLGHLWIQSVNWNWNCTGDAMKPSRQSKKRGLLEGVGWLWQPMCVMINPYIRIKRDISKNLWWILTIFYFAQFLSPDVLISPRGSKY